MEWKRIFNKKVLLLTMVCIIINCALFLYQEMSSTQIRKDYDRYISALEFFEGEEAVSRIRNAMQAERERLQQDVELITEV